MLFREVKRVCLAHLLKRVRRHRSERALKKSLSVQCRRSQHTSPNSSSSLFNTKRDSRKSDHYYKTHEHHVEHKDSESGSFRSQSKSIPVSIDFDNGKEWLKTMPISEVAKRAVLFQVISVPWIARYLIAVQRAALDSSKGSLSLWKNTVNRITHSVVFPTFCGGESVASCMQATRMFWEYPNPGQGLEIILDMSSEEQTGGAAAYDANTDTKIRVIEEFASQSKAIVSQSARSEIDGSVVRVKALKLTALMEGDLLGRMTSLIHREFGDQSAGDPRPFMDAADLEDLDAALGRCQRIIDKAIEHEFQLFVDAEQLTRNPGINFISRELMKRNHNRAGYPVLYNTYQLYLKESPKWIRYDLSYARSEGFVPGVKIVRGAYMNQEKQWAQERGDEDPICDGIEATHDQYNSTLTHILQEYAAMKNDPAIPVDAEIEGGDEKTERRLALAVCTHNRRSLEILSDECNNLKIDPRQEPYLLTGQLLGMCDHMSFAMKSRGFRAFKLAVFGQFQDVWPYLMRRLDENAEMLAATANENHVFSKEVRRRLGLPF